LDLLKICILDAQTLGQNVDLSPFKALGEVHAYDTTAPDQVIDRIRDSEIIVTNEVVLNRTELQHATQAKLICIAATGTNKVDLEYTRAHNITVTNVAGYSTNSVAQHTFALLFHLLGAITCFDNYVKSGQWSQSLLPPPVGSFWELNGKTWGIIGLGAIGQSVARIAEGFGCEIVYYSASGQNRHPAYSRVELEELLTRADVISIHAPINKQTYNLINYERLQLMKQHAILLNLGRGGIVNEADLARALDEGIIAGAGLDVFSQEPINSDNALLKIKEPHRLCITPHIAYSSQEALARLVREVVSNIDHYLKGTPINVVE
jgi:lactate dehydrogenase-like 2-hydroxyacid dehydrogenase